MLPNYQIILLGLSAASSVLCDSPDYYDHGVLISDPSITPEHESLSFTNLNRSSDIDITTLLEDDEDTIVNTDDAKYGDHSHSDTSKTSHPATNSSTGFTTYTPGGAFPDAWALVDDLDNEMSTSLSTPRFSATHEQFDRSIASATSPSSTIPSVVPSIGVPNSAKAALDWLTSTSNSTGPNGKSATLTSSTGSTSPSPGPTTTTSTKTTDPAIATLDCLTSDLDDKSENQATTTDSKHSSGVSAILSDSEATHTSAAAANRLGLAFW